MFKLDSFYYDVGGGCPILGFWSTSCLSWTVSTMMWVVVVQYLASGARPILGFWSTSCLSRTVSTMM